MCGAFCRTVHLPACGWKHHCPGSDNGIHIRYRDVFRIDAKAQRFAHVAGTGEKGYTGDGGDANLAKLNGPKGVSTAPDNSVYIADTENHVIRRIDTKTGVITTVAGTGSRGLAGSECSGDPLKCALARPHGVFAGRQGAIYIGDSETNRVRVVH
jgi:DNA-binding beta-propeller fold protein YncE